MNVAYLILALPLAGFVLLCLFGKRLGDSAAGWLATSAIGAAFVCTVAAFVQLLNKPDNARSITKPVLVWFKAGGFEVKASLLIDPLSITMALFVTGVGSLIHLYSIGYMKGDPQFHRFFVYLNLFAFSMLSLVLADSFLFMFLGWEGVGLCSYLLISFWFERERAAVAGKKAFVTNRVGDFGFMLAMFLIFQNTGSLTYNTVFSHGIGRMGTATAIALLLFLGAVGKSAQLPLYIWLPDAMEGPTPVSALIHAATMVTAGVYLMCRVSPIISVASSDVGTIIAWIGVLTALFAATIACAQDDIKKVLAYSTISQLGYMFLAVGSGAYVAGLFHMITHAFFKALLFLGAGAVIHGMHDEQDMKRMGALRKFLPVTAVTFMVGWLAIAGIPPFSGFWSKDDILSAAYNKSVALYVIGAFTAGLTAYYMTRQVALTFFGEERWREEAAHGEAVDEPSGVNATEPEPVSEQAGHSGHGGDHGEPHEAPWTMALPLGVLAFLAAVGGIINLPFGNWNFLERWLAPVLETFSVNTGVSTGLKIALAVVTTVLCVAGIGVGWIVWTRSADNPQLEPLILKEAWGVNDVFSLVFGTGGALVAAAAANFDKYVIDGAVNGVASVVRVTGGQVRRLQTGYVRNYALGLAAGAVVLLTYVFVVAGVNR